jgi:branched-chain amino acid transport system permease protein
MKIMESKIFWAISIVLISILLPLFISDYWKYVLTIAFYYTIMASTWNLLAGFTGQFSLGHHTFAMIGAYVSTLLMQNTGMPFLISIPVGIIAVTVISLLLGIVCLRVDSLYLVLVTWAFAEVVRNYTRLHYSFTGGDRGIESPLLFGTVKPMPYYYLFLCLAIITIILIMIIMRSRIGFYFRSIRDDAIAARSMGVNIIKYKVLVVAIASSLAGMAGAFYGHSVGLISPTMGEFNEMAMIIIFVVIGGMRTLSGPIIGALTVRILMEVLRQYAELRIVLLSAIVIILMRFYSGGINELIGKMKKRLCSLITSP